VIAARTHSPRVAWARHAASAVFFLREIALWLLIYPLYLLTREGVRGAPTAALRHAREVVDAERTLGLSVEHAIQQLATSSPLLRGAFDEYYELAFYPLLAGVLIWLGLRHRDVYGFTRRALILALGVAAIGFHDTVGMHDHDVGSFHGISYNPYAAMPSLHVGWSMIVALGVFRAVRSRVVRGAAIVHPLLMAAATIATGNHYLLDCIAGAGVAVLAIIAVGSPQTASEPVRTRARVPATMRAT
jgi:membrane-associated phospholipid phosphatase